MVINYPLVLQKSQLILVSLAVIWLAGGPQEGAGLEAKDPIGQRFQGEVLAYDIGFWIFDQVGQGRAAFRSLGNGRYEAAHEGKTLGMAGWLSRYRRDFYRSAMGTLNQGRRLIPLRFEEDVMIGRKARKRITVYDYAMRKVFTEAQKEGKTIREETDIPYGLLYDDPMTAFYNFRFGVYGKVEPGKEFFIRTLPRRGAEKTIRLSVASEEEAARRRAGETEKAGKDLLIKVFLDKELVGSLHGEVEVWFDKKLTPLAGVAKDVFLYGDIKGKLTYQGTSDSPFTPP